MVAKVKNALDIWAAFLTRRDLLNKDNLPKQLDNPALKKAIHVLDVMSFDAEEREAYESHLKWLMIEANTLRKYEDKRAREIAMRLIVDGMPLENVARMAELSMEIIQKLAAGITVE